VEGVCAGKFVARLEIL